MIKLDCRRCWGRKKIDGKVCFTCLGTGKIELTTDQLENYFREMREKQTEPDE